MSEFLHNEATIVRLMDDGVYVHLAPILPDGSRQNNEPSCRQGAVDVICCRAYSCFQFAVGLGDTVKRKHALLSILESGLDAGDELEERLPDEAKARTGTWEIWAPKDALCHVADWLERDIQRLTSPVRPMPSVSPDDLEEANKAVFAKYEEKSWADAVAFYRAILGETRRYVNGLGESELEEQIEREGGQTAAVWRIIAGHASWHLSLHLAAVYRREGMKEHATALEERTASLVAELDDSDTWQGTIKYNLACNYALCGDTVKAIELLGEAFWLNESLVEWSRTDPDLAVLRNDPQYTALYET
jgi:tetratricopeptide (TPR) repeat protein